MINNIAIAWRSILKRIILFAYFLLNSPPKANPPRPIMRTITTSRQAIITNIWAFSSNIQYPTWALADLIDR
mgnify:CR=1 FL=1